jgi:hypothetical protein
MSLHASGWSSKPPRAFPLLMASEAGLYDFD